MPLCVRCPTGHKLIVPDDRAGRLLRCPRCDETFVARVFAGDKNSRKTQRQSEAGSTNGQPGARKLEAAVNVAALDAALATLVEQQLVEQQLVEQQLVEQQCAAESLPEPPEPPANRPFAAVKPKSRAIIAEQRPAPAAPREPIPAPESAPSQESLPLPAPVPPEPVPPEPVTREPVPPAARAEETVARQPDEPGTCACDEEPGACASNEEATETSSGSDGCETSATDTPPAEAIALVEQDPAPRTDDATTASVPAPPHELAEPPIVFPSFVSAPIEDAPLATATRRQAPITPDSHWVPAAYVLAAGMIAAAVFSVVPAVWDVAEYLQFADSPFVARWALVLFALGVVQVAYAVYLIQLPDWTTVWVVTLQSLALAAMYAMVVGLVLISPADGVVVRGLELSDKLAGGKALLWCLAMVSVFTILTFFAGRLSVQWHRAETLLRRAGL